MSDNRRKEFREKCSVGGIIYDADGNVVGSEQAQFLTTLANELVRRGGQFGMLTVCAAGGMGHAMIIERAA